MYKIINNNYFSASVQLWVLVIVLISFTACVETVTEPPVAQGEISIEISHPTSDDSIAMGKNVISYEASDVPGGEGLTAIELIVGINGRDPLSMGVFPIFEDPAEAEIFIHTDSIEAKFDIDPYQFPPRIEYRLVAYNDNNSFKATEDQSPIYVNRRPAAPSNLILRKDGDKIFNLVWEDNSSNEEKFELWRKDGEKGGWFKIKDLPRNTISYTDHVESTVISYNYKIRAVNSIGASAFSNKDGSGVNSPSNLKAIALGASVIQLTWDDNSDNELGFRVERKDPITGAFIVVDILTPNSEEYFVLDLTPATSYTFRVASYSATSISDYSNEATAVTFTIDIPAPSILTADFDKGERAVVLNWKDNTDQENGTIIERKEGLTGIYEEIGFTDTDVNTYLDDDIEENKLYYYRARHTTEEGFKTPYSNEDSAFVPILAPEAPSDLKLFTFTQNLVYGLVWSDNSDDEEGFEIIRTAAQSGATFTITLPQNIIAYNDTLPDPSKVYTYKVRSFKGELRSNFSNEVSTLEDELEVPSNLNATQITGENKVELTWVDNSSEELGYVVERRKNTDLEFGVIAVLGPDSEYHLDDQGLVSDATYIYRVKAYGSLEESDYSNTAAVAILP